MGGPCQLQSIHTTSEGRDESTTNAERKRAKCEARGQLYRLIWGVSNRRRRKALYTVAQRREQKYTNAKSIEPAALDTHSGFGEKKGPAIKGKNRTNASAWGGFHLSIHL